MDKIFRKDVTYGNIKSQKHPGFTVFLEDTFSEKPKRREGKGGGVVVKLTFFKLNSTLKVTFVDM